MFSEVMFQIWICGYLCYSEPQNALDRGLARLASFRMRLPVPPDSSLMLS